MRTRPRRRIALTATAVVLAVMLVAYPHPAQPAGATDSSVTPLAFEVVGRYTFGDGLGLDAMSTELKDFPDADAYMIGFILPTVANGPTYTGGVRVTVNPREASEVIAARVTEIVEVELLPTQMQLDPGSAQAARLESILNDGDLSGLRIVRIDAFLRTAEDVAGAALSAGASPGVQVEVYTPKPNPGLPAVRSVAPIPGDVLPIYLDEYNVPAVCAGTTCAVSDNATPYFNWLPKYSTAWFEHQFSGDFEGNYSHFYRIAFDQEWTEASQFSGYQGNNDSGYEINMAYVNQPDHCAQGGTTATDYWVSDLPGAYLETIKLDDDNVTYAIGSADPDDLYVGLFVARIRIAQTDRFCHRYDDVSPKPRVWWYAQYDLDMECGGDECFNLRGGRVGSSRVTANIWYPVGWQKVLTEPYR